MRCDLARLSLFVGGILAIGDLTENLFGVFPRCIQCDLGGVTERDAAVFGADLILSNERAVGCLFASPEPQSKAGHVIIKFDVLGLALGHLEAIDGSLRE